MLAFLNCSTRRGVSEARVIEHRGSRREPPLRANGVVSSAALEHCAGIFHALVVDAEAGSGAAGPNAKPAISPGGRGKP
jgi:hypothetical protein